MQTGGKIYQLRIQTRQALRSGIHPMQNQANCIVVLSGALSLQDFIDIKAKILLLDSADGQVLRLLSRCLGYQAPG